VSPVKFTTEFECNVCHRAPRPEELYDADRPQGWTEISFRRFGADDDPGRFRTLPGMLAYREQINASWPHAGKTSEQRAQHPPAN